MSGTIENITALNFKSLLKKCGYIVLFLVILYFLSGGRFGNIFSGGSFGGSQKLRSITSPTFSPDNSKILFNYCEGYSANGLLCELATYEIASNKLHKLNPVDNELSVGTPAYLHDGSKITFACIKRDKHSNIYVMNTDGSGLRQLTHDYNEDPKKDGQDKVIRWNAAPSFSSDGKRIIFKRAAVERQRSMGGTMLSHWDAYEVDIETGQERRLTNYAFYQMSRPYNLPDGKGFIFSVEHLTPDKKLSSDIYIMGGGQDALNPAFTHGWYSTWPSVSSKGDILFLSETSKMDGIAGRYFYDLFIKQGDTIRRLTNRQFTRIAEPAISLDGTSVVFIASEMEDEGPRIWVMKSDGSGLTKLKKLEEQLIKPKK